MPAPTAAEPLPDWIYRSEAFAEDLIDEDADRTPTVASGGWQRAAAAARRGGRGLYGWLRRPAPRARLAT